MKVTDGGNNSAAQPMTAALVLAVSLTSAPWRRLPPISLNTDDPALCDTTFSQELLLAMEKFNFTLDEIKGLMLSALDQSFLEDYRKVILQAKLEQELAQVK